MKKFVVFVVGLLLSLSFTFAGIIEDGRVVKGSATNSTHLGGIPAAEFLRRGGEVPLTGNLDAGNYRIVHSAGPVDKGDLARRSFVLAQIVAQINAEITALSNHIDATFGQLTGDQTWTGSNMFSGIVSLGSIESRCAAPEFVFGDNSPVDANRFKMYSNWDIWALAVDDDGDGNYVDVIWVLTNSFQASITYLIGNGGGILQMKECSQQPGGPLTEGYREIWQSDGTGYGDDGDLCTVHQAGGILHTNTFAMESYVDNIVDTNSINYMFTRTSFWDTAYNWVNTSSTVYRGGASAFDYTNFTFDSSWHDLDLSAIVPQGARKVTIYGAVIDDTAGQQFRMRNNATTGSYVEAAWTVQVSGVIVTYAQEVYCDENRVIEYKCDPNLSNNSLLGFTVIGWE